LIAGLGLAGFAVYMAQNYIGAYENALIQERKKSTAAVPTREIYVATRAIAYGETITDDDIMLAPWAKKILPEGHFTEENPLNAAGAAPRVALRQIEKFDAMVQIKVSEPGANAGLTWRLEPGERAFAIKVDVTSGVSGFLRPGDHVDVYWTGRVGRDNPDRPQGDVTKLIEAGVRLIAIDQTAQAAQNSATIARTVTVAASPQQVAGLAQAQKTGELSLSLMASDDTTVAEVIEVDQRALLGLAEIEQQAERKPEVCTIRTRRGAEVVELPIPCTN
jgi:pilus assembly protein CpaB